MRFTKANIEALELPPGRTEWIVWDEDLPGFGCRVRATSKAWRIQYRVNRQQRSESLGDIRKVSLDDARKTARARFARVESGVDPAVDRDRARAEAAAIKLTLGHVSQTYTEARRDALRPATLRAMRWHFELWAPLRNKPIASITRADVAARLTEIVKTSGRVAAARARGTLSAMYSWAMREGLCEANVVTATNDPAAGIRARERVLADAELQSIWHACRDDDFGRIVRLLILLGTRRQEIGSLQWSEINLDTGIMTIPGDRTKSHRPLELTLPPAALDILRAVPRRNGSDYVFGRHTNSQGFSGWSYPCTQLNLRIAQAEGRPLAPWSLHDVRRAVRSGLGRLGIRPDIAEAVIGHARHATAVEAIYDRYSYRGEVAAALARWADRVMSVIEDREPRVVPLARHA
jgi:integrase